MRRLIKLALLAFGIRALLRRWKARKEISATPSPSTPVDDPADELRRKLAASRDEEEATVGAPPTEAVSHRRTEVHEHGRAALDEMKPKTED